ncbi:hypothetical protein BC941DRAFT_433838 [Chlamydoabsidia padenii]|nr:hypothetical protein BC941DRAFT_433838 [Chlamydoabsidia padenii]
MDSDIYNHVYERINEYKLTPEETQAIEKAKRQLNRHAIIGGIGLASASFFIGIKRRMNPIPLGLFTTAGMFMGTQIGFGTGAMAGIHTIKSLPNPDRLINLVKEVQTDMLAARGLVMDGPRSPPRPMTDSERDQYQKKLHEKQNNHTDDWQSSDQLSSYNDDQTWERKNDQRQQTDPWNDTFAKSRDGLVLAEKEWMDKDGSPSSITPSKNKWGDDMS